VARNPSDSGAEVVARRGPVALVFTDLDGTLLDHDSYDWRPATEALEALRGRGDPVIFNTSKPYGECVSLQREMALHAPLVVENGSAIHWPGGRPQVLGLPREEIVGVLESLRKERPWPLQSFTEMGIEGVMETTGLDRPSARRALDRRWSEPCRWQGNEEALRSFVRRAEQAGLRCLRGGRFLHLLGDTDKGRALRRVAAAFPDALVTVALGDSDNDVDMLRAADVAVRVRARGRSYPELGDHLRTIDTEDLGPEGWNRAVLELLRTGILG